MGEVYKARDTRLDRTVAIKILPSGDPDRRERFAREGKAIAALSHPNICVLHDVGQEAGTEFLVIEYLEGETLADRLKEGPLPPAAMITLATEIADALESAHAAGIVHRDLKPSNIFITRRGQAKVLDFGLAKVARLRGGAANVTNLPTMHPDRQLTIAGSALGTVAYMSPEQARGEDTDERSDIFSFGAMLYEMATGQPAFPGQTTAVVFDEILNRTPVVATRVNAAVPRGLDAVIRRALEKDREQRYQAAAELHKDLDALRRGAPVVTPPVASGSRPAALRPGALAVGAVALLGSLAWWFGTGRSAGGPIDSIAVLPFVNAGGNADADYLSQGIADTLTNNLTQIKGLRVVPRTLAAKYRNVAVDPRQAGRDLNARAIVTGRVVQRGDRLTIQAELIDAVSVAQLWGDQFDRSLADVLSVQSDISRAIADNLRRQLTQEDEAGLTATAARDPVAYQLYLRARHATLKRTREGYGQATQYLRQAIARDPAYAQAYAGLADAYLKQAYWGYLPSAETYGEAVEAARKALAIDDRSAEAHAALGWLHLYKDWNWRESEQAYQRALALDPTSADIHALYGESLATKRQFDEAIAEVKKGAALDPLSARITVSLGFLLSNAGRYDEAIQILKQAAELDPDFTLPRLDLARAYRLAGMADLAIAESRRMVDSGDPLGLTFLAAAYGRAGRRAEAMPLLQEMIAKARQSSGESFKVALVYASMSERDATFKWLDKAFAEHDTFLPWLNADPDFDPLRSDPRFDALIRRIGIPSR
jgi:eukaryotic-like serine/threonine-protein kinase